MRPDSPAARDVWRALTDVTEYRIYEDLRGGWRIAQPNLEQVGLLQVDYRGLDELAADHARWEFHPAAAESPVAERREVLRAILDQLRRKFAIARPCLRETAQQQMRRRAEQSLNEFWGFVGDGVAVIPLVGHHLCRALTVRLHRFQPPLPASSAFPESVAVSRLPAARHVAAALVSQDGNPY